LQSGKEIIANVTTATFLFVQCHLLYGSDTWQELKDVLEEDDLTFVLDSEHRPNCLIQLMTQSLRHVQLQDGERSLLDANISQFNDSISVCERLIRTPIPLSYTRLTSRFLVLWHLTLPVVLWDDCKLMVIPATFISAASLFCIEEVSCTWCF
jgi:putative membrane protein